MKDTKLDILVQNLANFLVLILGILIGLGIAKVLGI
ncbi:hypothetical protein HDG70_000821 [Carboxydothermus ferrireducens DSM 11255]|uniref:Uncharacterized protein n=1 Tax=Carboxydothermus ferrireducens DSM 11255 TaxID=1119529 RepID=A0ABX2RB71_9THEO|nr:hypothetical protein [Carboxydothermus ferrireducens DSM 11255]